MDWRAGRAAGEERVKTQGIHARRSKLEARREKNSQGKLPRGLEQSLIRLEMGVKN